MYAVIETCDHHYFLSCYGPFSSYEEAESFCSQLRSLWPQYDFEVQEMKKGLV